MTYVAGENTISLTAGDRQERQVFLSAVHDFMGDDITGMAIGGTKDGVTWRGQAIPGEFFTNYIGNITKARFCGTQVDLKS